MPEHTTAVVSLLDRLLHHCHVVTDATTDQLEEWGLNLAAGGDQTLAVVEREELVWQHHPLSLLATRSP
jgi:hypothetical protein